MAVSLATAMTWASALIGAVEAYALAGVVTALAFLSFGRMRGPVHFTIGARFLVLPGLIALWPYVVWRAIAARGVR
jgi:hypothetical protein